MAKKTAKVIGNHSSKSVRKKRNKTSASKTRRSSKAEASGHGKLGPMPATHSFVSDSGSRRTYKCKCKESDDGKWECMHWTGRFWERCSGTVRYGTQAECKKACEKAIGNSRESVA